MKHQRLLIEICFFCLVGILSCVSCYYTSSYAYGQGYSNGGIAGYSKGYNSGKSIGYSSGYTDGKVGGYSQGQKQGMQDELAALQDWMSNVGCGQTYNGYFYMKIWKDYQGTYQRSCLTQGGY